jgi:NAD(P)-dependent dehydrogenase (short-subunit alcohol dehydrogenase family)
MCNKDRSHLIWQYDLMNIDMIEESLMNFIGENNSVISGFIHSAGYMKTILLKMANVELFQTTFNINTISAALLTKVLLKRKVNYGMLKSIVFISSNISNFGAKAFSAYAASKSAVDGLMRCLAIELAPDVRVNSVLPGGIRTGMTEQMYENTELIQRMNTTYPLGPGKAGDIYAAVNFLLSDEARWITGQQLVVDGGRTINITG